MSTPAEFKNDFKKSVKKYMLKAVKNAVLKYDENQPQETLKKIVENPLYEIDDNVKVDIPIDTVKEEDVQKYKNIPIGEKVPEEYFEDENKKCAPIINYVCGSCIPLSLLILMAIGHNKTSNPEKIEIFEVLPSNLEDKYKLYLVKQFEHLYGRRHKKWLEADFMKNLDPVIQTILNTQIFRSKGPLDNEWLSNIHINEAMQLYEPMYKSFVYLKTLPRDFYDYLGYYIDFERHLREGQYKFGMVINSDKFGQGGSHWKMFYCDTKQGVIIYIDSGGSPPEKDIEKFIEYIKQYLENKHIKPRIYINKVQFQFGNSECGVFSMYFLCRILELSNIDPEYKKNPLEILQNEKINDKDVNRWRKVFFTKD